jgi:hypothetical protein
MAEAETSRRGITELSRTLLSMLPLKLLVVEAVVEVGVQSPISSCRGIGRRDGMESNVARMSSALLNALTVGEWVNLRLPGLEESRPSAGSEKMSLCFGFH